MNSEPAAPTKADALVSADSPRELAARLKLLRKQRRDDEREADLLPQLLRAIALVRRDRDAGVSQTLRAHRAHLERMWTDAEDLIVTSLQVALRVELRGADDTDPVVHRARRALRQGQEALRALSDTTAATS